MRPPKAALILPSVDHPAHGVTRFVERLAEGKPVRAQYERLLPFVEKPGRYVGGERGSIVKDPSTVRVRFALAFPEVYEIAQSHLGLQILYDILNRRSDVSCERVYAPWLDMEAQLRAHGLPLASLETCTPLSAFHIVGFSLQYELTYTNILAMLDLGGVPLLAADRRSQHPLVIAGGPCAFNPEPLAPFLDAVVLGDGEEVVHDIVTTYLTWDGLRRDDLLAALAGIDGVYVPSQFHPQHAPDGRLIAIAPDDPERPRVNKRVLADLNTVPLLGRQMVPSIDIVHDRVALEVMRGCVKGCRFCQAGYIYRPLRERDPQALLAHVEKLLRDSGYDEVSLLSLSTGDYSCINPLLTELMNRLAPQQIAVSLPSTRVDALSRHVLEQIRRVRKTGFTLAPEAGTQRLRDVIQKEYREDELVQAAELAFALGWRSLKLYFMLGLPSETEDDLHGIVDLARKVSAAGGHRRQVTASVSTFVPKPHTPFQWAPQLSIAETEARQSLLRRELRKYRIQFKWHDARLSHLEGVFSRGDRRLADVLLAAYRLGCRFDGWTDQCRWDLWTRAFAEAGTDTDWYHRRRILDEVLPWDHLDSGVSKTFLQRELAGAFARTLTPDCSIERCTYCGACDFVTIRNVTFHPRVAKGGESRGSVVETWAEQAMPDETPWPTRNWARLVDGRPSAPLGAAVADARQRGNAPPQPMEDAVDAQRDDPGCAQGNAEEWLHADRQSLEPAANDVTARPVTRVRLAYQKLERARFLGNRELTTVFVRAARRAQLPLAFSQGHHPLPRMSFGPALSLGVASLGEFLDIDLRAPRAPDEVMAALNRELPEGLAVLEATAVSLAAPSIDCALRGFSYSISFKHLPRGRLTPRDVDACVAAFEQATSFPMRKTGRGGGAVREIDARPLVAVRRTDPETLLVHTVISRAVTIKPHHFVSALLGLSTLEAHLLQIVKVGTSLAEASAPAMAAVPPQPTA